MQGLLDPRGATKLVVAIGRSRAARTISIAPIAANGALRNTRIRKYRPFIVPIWLTRTQIAKSTTSVSNPRTALRGSRNSRRPRIPPINTSATKA